MIEIECWPLAISGWLAICPKRPKPISSTLPVSPSGFSTPASDCTGFGTSLSSMVENGVSTIEMITVAVKMALSSPVSSPPAVAVVNSTKANSPPCAISTARSSASALPLPSTRANP